LNFTAARNNMFWSSILCHVRLMPLPYARSLHRVATALYGNQYHNSETMVYEAALSFQRGCGGAAVMSTQSRLQGNKKRWQPGRTKFRATQTLCDVEEGLRRRSNELPVARSGNCLCCYNPTRQRISLFVRTGLITSLWFKISKDRYERSHHLPYRHPEAVAVYMDRKDPKC